MKAGAMIAIGGGALVLWALRGSAAGAASSLLGSLTAPVKLGNADPGFEPWLAQEVQKLMGAASGTAGFKQKDHDWLANAIRSRHMPDYYKNHPGDCGTAHSSLGTFGVSKEIGAIGSAGVATAGTIATIMGTSIKAIPVIGQIISGITLGLGLIFGGHAVAVAKEQGTLCQAVPAANQWLDQIDQAYRSGQIGGAQATQALDAIYTQWENGVQTIIKPPDFSFETAQQHHQCNAACVYLRALRGIIDAKELFDY